MRTYASYYYYTTAYGGTAIPERLFDRYAARASAYIDNNVSDVPEDDKVRHCMCEIADAMYAHAGRDVVSVSNDGYTEQYKISDADAECQQILSDYMGYNGGKVRFI